MSVLRVCIAVHIMIAAFLTTSDTSALFLIYCIFCRIQRNVILQCYCDMSGATVTQGMQGWRRCKQEIHGRH